MISSNMDVRTKNGASKLKERSLSIVSTNYIFKSVYRPKQLVYDNLTEFPVNKDNLIVGEVYWTILRLPEGSIETYFVYGGNDIIYEIVYGDDNLMTGTDTILHDYLKMGLDVEDVVILFNL